MIPDSRLDLDTTDITVVFEQSYKEYQSLESNLTTLSGDRSQYSYMVHSLPSRVNLQKFVDSLSRHAEYLYVSTSNKNYYETFGSKWKDFTRAMPT